MSDENMNDQRTHLISRSVCAMITAMGMQAENKQREFLGQSMVYTDVDFRKLIDEHKIGWNDAILCLRGE